MKTTSHIHHLMLAAVLLTLAAGCRGPGAKKNNDFFTSGSREADQRASQRMAKNEQLAGSSGAKEKTTTRSASGDSPTTNGAVRVEAKLALFDRLGGEAGISNIVVDFTARAIQDPRVNWERKDVKHGGLFGSRSAICTNSPQNVAVLNKHMVQFIALATGGPAHYEGKEIPTSHASMKISNSEFDAAIGDLKASLDKLQIANKEQKELLAIIESTRPEIVTER